MKNIADPEEIIMTIISSAGEAKKNCFEALRAWKNGDRETADRLLEQADELLHKVCEMHNKMIGMAEAFTSNPMMLLLLIHAEDIYMSTESEKEIIRTLIS